MTVVSDPTRRIRALGTASWPTDRVLVIRENPGVNTTALDEIIPKEAHRIIIDSDNLSLRREIVAAINDNTWVVIDGKADLAPDSVTVLKEISRGAVRDNTDTWHDLPSGFRFIAVIERSVIEKQSYPNFLNLFDTFISLPV
jgi:hypothetical protein